MQATRGPVAPRGLAAGRPPAAACLASARRRLASAPRALAAPPPQQPHQRAAGPQQQQQRHQLRRGAAARRGPAPPAAFQRSPSGRFDPLKDVQRELGMPSNRLNPAVRDAVERAVEALGYRATVGDVAARAGVKLSEADEALKALALDALGHLEVSSDGEVVYSFDRGFRAKLRSRSLLQRLRPAWRKAAAAGAYLVRVAFGGALIASVAVVWLAIVALTSARDGDRRDRGGYGGGYYGGGPSVGVWIDPYDLIMWADPRYAQRARARLDGGERMNFVEGIFSFVFGDGDPNMSFQERRWRALGAHIQRLGGVVSAEEMAPFLDPPPLPRRARAGPNKYEDEAFVLPALIRFGGEPFVGDSGGLLYRFPALQVQAGGGAARDADGPARVPLERDWEFSAASPGQQAGALALGVANVIGVVVLSSLLSDPIAKLSLFQQGFGFVLGLLPALQAYAGAFFAIPLVRALVDARRNAAIEERNDARLQAVDVLRSSGSDRELSDKLAAARELGGARVIGRSDILYTTEQGIDAADAAAFDAKLGRGAQPQQQQERRPRGAPAPPARQIARDARGNNRVDDVLGRRPQRLEAEREREREYEARKQARGGAGRRRDDWDDLDRW